MPLLFNRKIGSDIIAMWHIAENELASMENTLPKSERLGIGQVKSLLIKRQKLAVLFLLNKVLGGQVTVEYNADGKPILLNHDMEVSMTHSQERVAIMLSPKLAGLDLQLIDPKIEKIIPRFLSPQELENIDNPDRLDHAHVLWGAKEALYKIYSKRGLTFSEQLLIKPFTYSPDGGIITGKVLAEGQEWSYQLKYEKIDGYMLVYLLNA